MKKNKILIVIFGLSISVIVLFFVVPSIYFNINYKRNLGNQLMKVSYANREILSGEVIYSNLISYREIKEVDFSDDYIQSIESLVGKCVKDNIVIMEGDFFHRDYIEECK